MAEEQQEQSSWNYVDFEDEGTNYLYNLDPATGNLFYLKNIEDGSNSGFTINENLIKSLRYRVKSVKLDNTIGLEFNSDRIILPGNPICINSVKEAHNVTIEWVEDSLFRIQKFHKEWIERWFKGKQLVDGTSGKLLNFTFTVFCFKNANNDGFGPLLETQDAYTINLNGCAPQDLSDFSFSYDEQDNGKVFVARYFVKDILITSGDNKNLASSNEFDKNLTFPAKEEQQG